MAKSKFSNCQRISLTKKQSNQRTSLPFVDYRGNELFVPVYSRDELSEDSCSKFVRLAAKDIFGFDYVPCNAWDRIYSDDIIAPTNSFKDLEQLSLSGILRPGMIIAIENFESKYSCGKDKNGSPRQYTHVALCLGKDKFGNATFCEQWGDEINIQNLAVLARRKLTPKYVLDSKPF